VVDLVLQGGGDGSDFLIAANTGLIDDGDLNTHL
jgi:hypothetical protein